MEYNKKVKRSFLIDRIVTTLMLSGPPIWLIINIYDPIPKPKHLRLVVASIICLLIIGFMWGSAYRNKEYKKILENLDKIDSDSSSDINLL